MPKRIKDIPTQARSAAADDFLPIDGATNNSRRISPHDLVGQFRNALDPRGGVALDGTTDTGWTATLTGQSLAADPFSISRVFRVPGTTPSAFSNLVCIGPNLASNTANGSFSVRLSNNANAVLDIVLTNGSGQTRRLLYDLVGNYGGKVVNLVVVRPASGEIQAFINGVQISLTLNTATASAQDSITSTHMFGGRASLGNSFTDYSATLYNLALSAADVQEIYELGGAVPERFKWGAQQVFGSNSALAVGADGTALPATGGMPVSVVSATRTGGTGTNAMRGTSLGGNLGIALSAPAGATVTVSFWIRTDGPALSSAGWRVVNRWTALGTGAPAAGTAAQGFGTAPDGTWRQYSATFTPTEALGSIMITNTSGGASWLEVDDFSVKVVGGAIVHLPLNDGAGYQLRDDSTNRLHALMTTTGVSHVLPKPGGAFPIRGATNTSGNQQLGGAAIVPLNCQILRVRARTQSGTSTVSLGNASGGAQIVSAAALTTSWQVLTIVGGAHITSTTNLWANSNNGNVIEWDIEAEELRT